MDYNDISEHLIDRTCLVQADFLCNFKGIWINSIMFKEPVKQNNQNKKQNNYKNLVTNNFDNNGLQITRI